MGSQTKAQKIISGLADVTPSYVLSMWGTISALVFSFTPHFYNYAIVIVLVVAVLITLLVEWKVMYSPSWKRTGILMFNGALWIGLIQLEQFFSPQNPYYMMIMLLATIYIFVLGIFFPVMTTDKYTKRREKLLEMLKNPDNISRYPVIQQHIDVLNQFIIDLKKIQELNALASPTADQIAKRLKLADNLKYLGELSDLYEKLFKIFNTVGKKKQDLEKEIQAKHKLVEVI